MPRLEVEELLERYAARERDFEISDLSGVDLSGASWCFNAKDAFFNNTIMPDGTVKTGRG
ncbi:MULTISPECIES: hypothetical protein [Nostocales]|uniref:Pentapeptide repeat-containing protein n=3 Tax=Nostocales TaxID=1161 RepID=A0A0C1NDI5_9CYAN|nr:hypothetical protein [Tolypothrix bouteillei]